MFMTEMVKHSRRLVTLQFLDGVTDPCFPMQYRVYIPRKYLNDPCMFEINRE